MLDKLREGTMAQIGIRAIFIAISMFTIGWGSIIFFSEGVTLMGTLQFLGVVVALVP